MPFAPEQKKKLIEAVAKSVFRLGGPIVRTITGRSRMDLAVRPRTRLELNKNSTLAQLIESLGSGNSVQRELAAELIVNVAGDKAAKLAALHECFADKTPHEMVQARFDTGTTKSSIMTTVKNLDRERTSVARALALLGPTKDIPSDAWLALLGAYEPRLLRRAMREIGAAPTASAVLVLVELTRHPDPTITWEAITTLGMISPDAKAAITTLQILTAKKRDKATAVRAASALRSIRAAGK